MRVRRTLIDETDGVGMRTDLWRRSVARYVIPHLPGEWTVSGALLYQEPSDWFLRGLVMSAVASSSRFKVTAVVQLLAVPSENITGPYLLTLGHGTPYGIHKAPATLADAEPTMKTITSSIQSEAIPYLVRLGSLAAYTADATERIGAHSLDPYFHERLSYARLLGGDIDGGLRAAADAQRAAEPIDKAWALDLQERVSRTADAARRDLAEAVAILRENATRTPTAVRMAPVAG